MTNEDVWHADHRVLVIGGGIGGLTTAIALRRVGADVRVVERAADFAAHGAGITLQPNAVAILDALGVWLRPEDVNPIGKVAMIDARGRVLMGGSDMVPPGDLRALNIRRPDLHRVLLETLGPDMVTMGAEVRDIAVGPKGVEVAFEGGTTDTFDVVVGADGISSAVRRHLLPEPRCLLRFAGQTCWRFVLEAPDLAPDTTIERWSVGRRVGVVPLARGGIYVYVVETAEPGAVGPETSRVEYLQERFAGLDDRLDAILARAVSMPPQIHHGDLADLPDVCMGRGPVVLIGDAAHAMTPNLGQGAGTAIEDAAALMALWGQAEARELAERLTAVRHDRVAVLGRRSWQLGQVAHWRHPVARWIRDTGLRLTPKRRMIRSVVDSWEPGLVLAREVRERLSARSGAPVSIPAHAGARV